MYGHLQWIQELARKAYEAYCGQTGWKSAVTGADLPPWDNCPKAVRQGWVAVVEALVLEIWK